MPLPRITKDQIDSIASEAEREPDILRWIMGEGSRILENNELLAEELFNSVISNKVNDIPPVYGTLYILMLIERQFEANELSKEVKV